MNESDLANISRNPLDFFLPAASAVGNPGCTLKARKAGEGGMPPAWNAGTPWITWPLEEVGSMDMGPMAESPSRKGSASSERARCRAGALIPPLLSECGRCDDDVNAGLKANGVGSLSPRVMWSGVLGAEAEAALLRPRLRPLGAGPATPPGDPGTWPARKKRMSDDMGDAGVLPLPLPCADG